MKFRSGSCACGQLQVTCCGEPRLVSVCHCLACQRRTGSTYGVAVFFMKEDLRTEGRTNTYRRSSDSGHPITFRFCPDCGSTVFWEPERKPDMVAVAVGAFADPAFPPPTKSAWEEYRHPWVELSL